MGRMQFCNIVPDAFVGKYKTSNRHLLLAHKIGNNEYTAKYRRLEDYKILDNGYFENFQSPTIPELVEKAKVVRANMIVLPDTFYHKEIEADIRGMMFDIPKKYDVMGIALGKNLNDSLKMFELLQNNELIDCIGVPDRLLEKYTKKSRVNFLQLAQLQHLGEKIKPVHCLALDDSYTLEKLAQFPFIKSVDSTSPFKLGYFHLPFPIEKTTEPRRPSNYFDIKELTKWQDEFIRLNVKDVKKITRGDYHED